MNKFKIVLTKTKYIIELEIESNKIVSHFYGKYAYFY